MLLQQAFWRNHKGVDCKVITPEARCLCNHLYKEHYKKINPIQTHCKKSKCSCREFFYIPITGFLDGNCLCGHSNRFHDPITHHCTKGNCGGCNKGFNIAFICTCGERFNEHKTFFERIGAAIDIKEDFKEIKEKPFIREELLGLGKERIEEEGDLRTFLKKNRLMELNKRIEKPFKKDVIEERLFDEIDDITALSLYNTPHTYIRLKIKLF